MTKKKICLVSSSGGHYEQLKMLDSLKENYEIFYVTERTSYANSANYFLTPTGLNDKFYILKMIKNFFYSLLIFFKERPFAVVTTGTMVAIPLSILAKIFKKKLIYIESFARVTDSSKTGELMYKIADLFIVQWESMKEIYPKAVYGGSLY